MVKIFENFYSLQRDSLASFITKKASLSLSGFTLCCMRMKYRIFTVAHFLIKQVLELEKWLNV